MKPNNVDEYILSFPEDKQKIMNTIREIIRKEAPEAMETMSWGMPTYKLHGNLVHFAMAKAHLGFYPGSSGVEVFIDRLKDYKHSKGAIQFPLDKELPQALIIDIIQYRIQENMGEQS